MDAPRVHDESWTYHHPLGELRCASLTGHVDVSRPELGLQRIALRAQPLNAQLLCVRRHADSMAGQASTNAIASDWPLAVADAYVRGGDLVATYQPADAWPYAPQIYWRADRPESVDNLLGSLALLVSVQTHLLGTCPRITVTSEIASDEVLHVVPAGSASAHAEPLTAQRDCTLQPRSGLCCLVRRLADAPFSYAEIMPASDFRELTVRHGADGACRTQWKLFADFLEKGVIRRARLQAAFLPRQDDVELAAACCQALEGRPLPLTT